MQLFWFAHARLIAAASIRFSPASCATCTASLPQLTLHWHLQFSGAHSWTPYIGACNSNASDVSTCQYVPHLCMSMSIESLSLQRYPPWVSMMDPEHLPAQGLANVNGSRHELILASHPYAARSYSCLSRLQARATKCAMCSCLDTFSHTA
jgi:hypothetical protein